MGKVYSLHQFTRLGQNIAAEVMCGSKAEATKIFKAHFGKTLMGRKKVFESNKAAQREWTRPAREVREVIVKRKDWTSW